MSVPFDNRRIRRSWNGVQFVGNPETTANNALAIGKVPGNEEIGHL